MTNSVPLETWNHVTLALVQAMLGAVSPNFRIVTLARDGEVWKLQFVLEAESEADRDEIEDIAAEFEVLQEASIQYEVEVRITPDAISWPSPPTRVVFRRREG